MKNRIATFKNFVGELSVNYKRTSLPTKRIIDSFSATEFMYSYFDEIMDDHEEVKVLHLNRSNHIVNVHHVSSGSDAASLVPIKDIVRQAILIKTNGIIMFHNHPSGSLKPSQADIDISKKLKAATALFDIKLLDSIIITRESHTSMNDKDLLD